MLNNIRNYSKGAHIYIGMELPREQDDFSLKRERARTIDASMNYIAERSWYLLRHTDPPISKESFENEVVTLRLLSHPIQLNMNHANIIQK